VVSELVTNAIDAIGAHPGGTPGGAWLRFQQQGGLVLVEVADGIAAPAVRKPPPAGDAERGRGRLIVEALSEEWDCYLVPGGKVVAATVRTRGGRG
jgi:hypothetical protein